jgi:hypothetical protein
LLESRLVRSLTDQGYFVEPNQVLRDPRTGKSREIDLVAEYYSYNRVRRNVCVKTHFVVEAINNRFPFVLTTERPSTPNADFESYIKFAATPEPNPFIGELDLYEEEQADWENLFSQYCLLTKKKSDKEFMASHPDDVYGSLLKLSEYVEDAVDIWNSRDGLEDDKFWRLFFWQPMLVLSGQLVSVRLREDGAAELQEVSMGRLEFNWHADDRHRTTVIEVLTEQFFLQRVATIVEKDDALEEKVHALRQRLLPSDAT